MRFGVSGVSSQSRSSFLTQNNKRGRTPKKVATVVVHQPNKRTGDTRAIASLKRELALLKTSTGRQPIGFQDHFDPSVLTRIIKAESRIGQLPLGTTKEGRRFAYLALHPCDEVAPTALQYPDGLNVYSVPARNMVTNPIVPFPYTSGGTNIGLPTTTWDVQFLFLPTPELPCLYRWKPSEVESWCRWVPMPIDNATRYGQTDSGLVDTTGGANQGHLLTPAYVRRLPSRMVDCQTLRRVYRGFTTILNCNDLTNQGMVTGTQWASVSDEIDVLPLTGAAALVTHEGDAKQNEIKALVYGDIPRTTADMFAKSNEVEHYRANEGMYMISHGIETPNLYRETTGSTMLNDDVANSEKMTGKPIVLFDPGYATAANEVFTMDFFVQDQTLNGNGTSKLFTVTDKLNYKVGSIMYTGIDKTATIDIKMVDCWQAVPNSDSAQHYNRVAPCDPDPTAIESVRLITNRMKHAYPAVYNDGGLLATVVGSLASTLLPKVIPWISGLWNKYVSKKTPPKPVYVEEDVD